MQHAYLLPLPEALAAPVRAQWQECLARAETAGITLLFNGVTQDELHHVWACSAFVAQRCVVQPALLADLLDSGDLVTSGNPPAYAQRLERQLRDVADEEALAAVLRETRLREMVRIAWRDIAGRADLQETTRDLSALAEACIEAALTRLHGWLGEEYGVPSNAAGEPQALVVLGMGKLGAGELNFSSDIDLIFAYPEEGETRGGRRGGLSNEEYFRRLGQALIAALDRVTPAGRVFRVDMRLRPFGDSGPLAMGFDGMEAYYQLHGRDWERYAMVKARVVAGNLQAGERLMKMLRPFVYRRYLDYGAFEALRNMKQLIAREVRRKGMEDHVKLGPGGIREVEFIGQAFQLIRGGREPSLQERRILAVLERLPGLGLLPAFVADDLRQSYTFLRNTEHRLQEYRDEQTHTLPTDAPARLRLAWSMGFPVWEDFRKALRGHMARVHSHFEQVFEAPQAAPADAGGDGLADVWRGVVPPGQAEEMLARAGFGQPPEALRLLAALRDSHACRALSQQGRERLDRLMPLLIGAAGRAQPPDAALTRLLTLIETIAQRTAYLSLLVENPLTLSQLVKLCAASPWIGRLLARHPLLLDELMDPRLLYTPPDRASLAAELRARLTGIAEDDLEQQMEALRNFKQAQVLRVAAADVMGVMPLMVVSDHLTWIAEVILEQTLGLARHQLTVRHGRPMSEGVEQGFAIVGYGKLGGIELGYGSDLDLVFLYEGGPGTTDGAKPVENAVFFARLAQRIIHILGTHTPAGVLYETDLRLRPSGASGLLVSSLAAFGEYQRQDAWTWEHQALVRARVVAGSPGVEQAFARVRAEILQRQREAGALRREVREMRARMRKELASRAPGVFDLKQGPGGIADIEFMVQYAVLAWAARQPELCRYPDNIRLLELLAAGGRLAEADAALLCDAYRAFRARLHRLTLQEAPALVPDTEFAEFRAAVQRIWHELLEADG